LGYNKRKADGKGTTIDDELTDSIVHGLCHLLGYTHANDEDFSLMSAKEEAAKKSMLRLLKDSSGTMNDLASGRSELL